MRKGHNPNKGKKNPESNFYHQVIIPVHIPEQNGYFLESLEILKLCLDSLIKTSHKETFFTIVNNGSNNNVKEYLNALLEDSVINELIHTEAIGKVNAVLKGLVGHNFELVTITDADVLFLNNWQEESYKIFNTFSKTGVVCTTPSSKSYKTLVSNVYWDKFFSSDLKFRPLKNPEALKAFAHSIGNDDFYNESQLQSCISLSKNNVTAVVGAGHFVATYRGDIFNELHQTHSDFSLGANSLHELLDKPVVKKDYWRLSTEGNFTYHMGNVTEPWMKETCGGLLLQESKIAIPNLSENRAYNKVKYKIKNKFFQKLIMKTGVLRRFLIWKGLEKKNAKEYLSW